MKKILKFFLLPISIILASGCSSFESGLSSMFETINDANPLPKNYAEKANSDYGPSSSYNSSQKHLNNNSNLKSNMTFEEWHNNQYRN